MIVDSSALIAIFLNEPEKREFLSLLVSNNVRVSTVTVLETAMVLQTRHADNPGYELDSFLARLGAEIVPFDAQQLAAARLAFRRFGKGNHPARLNFCDCVAYALSRTSGEPLLFKGDDFAKTDVGRAT